MRALIVDRLIGSGTAIDDDGDNANQAPLQNFSWFVCYCCQLIVWGVLL